MNPTIERVRNNYFLVVNGNKYPINRLFKIFKKQQQIDAIAGTADIKFRLSNGSVTALVINGESTDSYAPYNFIPLNKYPEEFIQYDDATQNGCLSGFLDINVETLTPLFIRGEGTDFFKVAGTPVIPGSSLRGLTRNLVEIMSYGKLGEINDKLLYYRTSVAKNENPLTGFLVKKNGEYYVHPCSPNGNPNNNRNYRPYRQNEQINTPFHYIFTSNDCKFSTGEVRGINIWHFYNKKNNIRYAVPPKTKDLYLNDKDRDANVPNIFESAGNMSIKGITIPNGLGVPVFFTLNNDNQVDYISHCKWGRTPYNNKISTHIPQQLREGPKDFTDSIFGSTEYAGKVRFEDAYLQNSDKDYYLKDANTIYRTQILSSPKPTAYQLYKEADEGKPADWNTDTEIRGNKIYWHRQTPQIANEPFSWVKNNNDAEASDAENEPIQPIKSGRIFTGRIRFNNLSEQELGALLTALQLPDDCAHKLGMGKPLGLGSVKITAGLTIIDRAKRYDSIFNEDGEWNEGIDTDESVEGYQNKFKKYITEKLENSSGSFWELDRMKELKTLLTWNETENKQTDWLDKTKYMDLGTFDHSKLLPKATEI